MYEYLHLDPLILYNGEERIGVLELVVYYNDNKKFLGDIESCELGSMETEADFKYIGWKSKQKRK